MSNALTLLLACQFMIYYSGFHFYSTLPVYELPFKNKKPGSVNLVFQLSLLDVGRDGIEPPTHGFSVHCSTD